MSQIVNIRSDEPNEHGYYDAVVQHWNAAAGRWEDGEECWVVYAPPGRRVVPQKKLAAKSQEVPLSIADLKALATDGAAAMDGKSRRILFDAEGKFRHGPKSRPKRH